MPGVPPEKCEAVDKILKDLPARLFPLEQELKVLNAKLEALVVDAKSDEAAIAARLDDIAKVRAAIAKIMVDVRRQVLKETGILLPPLKGRPGPMPGPGPGPDPGPHFPVNPLTPSLHDDGVPGCPPRDPVPSRDQVN
jgi:hypothetical protein